MPIETIYRELRRISRLMKYWQAELWAAAWISVAAGLLWLGGVSDVLLHLGTAGRIIMWLLTVGACVAGLWRVYKALATSLTIEAVAARIEKVFPQLDNRLINVVQFSLSETADPMRLTYVRQGVPNWREVRVRDLKERKPHQRAYIALAVAVALVSAPFLWMSEGWTNALARIVNPFSSRPPSVLAQIVGVTPGNAEIVSGNPFTLRTTVTGKAKLPVSLDYWPADDHAASVKIGELTGKGTEEFAFQFPRVTANLAYRIRAGDTASEKFHVTTLPPLSIGKLEVTVQPRKESGRPKSTFNGLTDQIVVPRGATLSVAVACNRPLLRGFLTDINSPVAQLAPVDGGKNLAGSIPISDPGTVTLTVCAAGDEKLITTLKVALEPDRPPTIKIIAPTGNVTLAPGAMPAIQWEASDDFGLTKVTVEQVTLENLKPEEAASTAGTVMGEWPIADNARTHTGNWKSEVAPQPGHSVGYRVVAFDNYGPGEPHRTQSQVLMFQATGAKELAEAASRRASETEAALAKLVEMQTRNLTQTQQLNATLETVKPEQWSEVQDTQKEIRRISGVLLGDPKKPLGSLHEKVHSLFEEQMQQAIVTLQLIPTSTADAKATQAARAIQLEDWILRILAGVQALLPQVEKDKQITDVLAMMDILVKSQTEVVAATKTSVASTASTNAPLAKKQDRLAGDTDQFVAAAKSASADIKGTDATFSELLAKVAGEIGTRKVSGDMLKAAEQLDDKAPAKALPFEESALKNLEELHAMLNSWRVEKAEKTQADLVAAMKNAANKIERLREMQKKIIESMRAMKPTEDKTTDREEDLHKELAAKQKGIEEALLKVATDLHIFPESNVGNEVAKEVVTRVTNVEQAKGSEHAPAQERALQKEEFILKDMDKVAARLKDGEASLLDHPDNVRALTENFDKQEMATMAMVPLDNKVEDLIGELMKQDKDIAEKVKSSATNQATKDTTAEGKVAEGEWANYSAKGKSGNTEPKHNEQSGRSNVGRQGQSNGETAAGAGKINKGDDNIEKRMTQDSAQSGEMGKIDDSEAKAMATGGGKLSGTADDYGMSGQGPRRDAKNQSGSILGEQALLRKRAESIYGQASLQHVRTGSLDTAIRHMREAEEAIREARPIQEIREFRQQATDALRKTKAELSGGTGSDAIDSTGGTSRAASDRMAGVVDEAPAAYQGMVSEYYKAINNAPH
ncbi:MAG: hypothetical protein WCH57_01115 [Verrucomicrobiota bacterium]